MADTRFPKRFGKYILLDRINAGGMAEVYRAKVTGVEQFQRLVAIKCMLPALGDDDQFIAMFIDEAKLAAQLSHPNVVQIYELGRVEEQLYIAMELVNGRDLRHIVRTALRQKTPLSVGFAAYVIAKAAEGLDYAHRKVGVDGKPLNLVHRDISPQNILVSYDGDVKVVDFGIAKAEARATETQAGVLKGKFSYMAPEQALGDDLDRRVDIFALGAVLYEVLTGSKLFTGDGDLSILGKVRQAQLPDIAAKVPGAPPELEAVLKKALARDKEERFAYAADLAEALEPLLIENRSIFGAKKAAALMQQLYAEEINLLATREREWAAVTAAQVVQEPAQTVAEGATQVFESTFASASPPQPPSGTVPTAPPEPPPDAGVAKTELMTLEELKTLADDGWGDAPALVTPVEPMARVETQDPAYLPTQMLDVGSRSGASRNSVAKAPQRLPTSSSHGRAERAPAKRKTSPLIFVGIAVCFCITVAAITLMALDSPQPVVAGPVALTEISPPQMQPAPVPVEPTATPSPVAIPVPVNEPARSTSSKRASTDERVAYLAVMSVGASATVFVDGKEIGASPQVSIKVRPGKHKVRLVTEAGEEKTEEVTVTTKDSRTKPKKVMVRF